MSATEDGISDLMTSYLRNRGVSVVTQVSISTPGTRSQPDFQITEGRNFLGEAKWENKKWEGFGEARDYSQLTGVEGTFLIVYPEELRQSGGRELVGFEDVSDWSKLESAVVARGYDRGDVLHLPELDG